jgi:nicotinamide mononucleotide transporter
MEAISFLWDINFVVFELLGNKISLIELIGSVAGLLSVWFGTRNNILVWHFGFVNVIAFGIIFFQINLYADMLLQVFYFSATFYGLYKWKERAGETNLPITTLSTNRMLVVVFGTIQVALLFLLFTQYFPKFFQDYSVAASSYPVYDSLLSAASVTATLLMARRRLESWLMWIVIDSASVILYLKKEVLLIAAEFGVVTLLAVYGYYSWRKIMKVSQ